MNGIRQGSATGWNLRRACAAVRAKGILSFSPDRLEVSSYIDVHTTARSRLCRVFSLLRGATAVVNVSIPVHEITRNA